MIFVVIIAIPVEITHKIAVPDADGRVYQHEVATDPPKMSQFGLDAIAAHLHGANFVCDAVDEAAQDVLESVMLLLNIGVDLIDQVRHG